MWHHEWVMGHDWTWSWWIPFGHFWFLIFLIVLFFVLVLRSPHRRYPPPPHRSAALDTLEQRYAKGEIQREEYLQKKSDLGGGQS